MGFFSRKTQPAPERVEPRLSSRSTGEWLADFQYTESPRAHDAALLRARFSPHKPPRGVVPDGMNLAMDAAHDSALTAVGNWAWAQAGAGRLQSWMADGLGFMGYPYLAEMAQRAEFRKPCDVIARECVREWLEIKAGVGDDSDTDSLMGQERVEKELQKERLAEKVTALEAELKRLGARDAVHKAILHGLLYGLGHIWIDIEGIGTGPLDQDVPLLLTPEAGLKGRVKRLVNIEPVWTVPNSYNADNPLRADYYRPENWWVQGCLIHATRLLTTVPYEVSDLFKPAFNFGGLSLTQQLRPYVHNYLRTRNSVANLVANFSKLVLKTDMAARMQTCLAEGSSGDKSVIGRATFMQNVSEGQDTIVADKENEDVSIVSAPLGGLDHLQAQAMEAMASIPGIPLVKLFGIAPQGLNASSEGEIRVFYDEISSIQEQRIRPILEKIFELAQLNLWGEIDPDIEFAFKPLWQMDDRQAAEIGKMKIESLAVATGAGFVSCTESRQVLAKDDESIFSTISLPGEAPGIPEGAEMEDLHVNSRGDL